MSPSERLSFDVVVVGAGVAGSRLARLLAEKGFYVALIDRKPRSDIGQKTCGDAIGKHHFDDLGIPYPSGEEVEARVKGIKLYSPDEEVVWTVDGEGFELNRHAFGQRLLREAERAGAEVYDRTVALGPIVERGAVRGVYARVKGGEKVEFRARITVDASGATAIIRARLPREWPVSEPLRYEDASIAYREIRITRVEIEDYEYIRIYLSQRVSPGGYWWLFPKGPTKVNVGLGVKGGSGSPNPRDLFYKYLAVRRELADSKILHAGGGIVPTRRPLDSMVAPGFMTIGDAGVTVNPVHGGGMGSSLIAADRAAKVASEALETGDVSLRGLWRFTREYNLAYGAKQAALDIMRIFLQSIGDDDLNFVMHRNLITEADLYYTSVEGDLKLSIVEKALRILRGVSRPTLLSKLKTLSDYMRLARRVYLEYPESPEGFEHWRARAARVFEGFISELRG